MARSSEETIALINDVLDSSAPGIGETFEEAEATEGASQDWAEQIRSVGGGDDDALAGGAEEWRPFAEWAWGELAPSDADADLPDWFDEFTTTRELARRVGRDVDEVRDVLKKGPRTAELCFCSSCLTESVLTAMHAFGAGISESQQEALGRMLDRIVGGEAPESVSVSVGGPTVIASWPIEIGGYDRESWQVRVNAAVERWQAQREARASEIEGLPEVPIENTSAPTMQRIQGLSPAGYWSDESVEWLEADED